MTTTGPSGVEISEVPEPVAGPGQVAIDVHAVGVSFPDLLLSQGLYQLRPDPPFTLGGDLSGVVVADAGDFRAGQRVVAALWHGGAAERVVAAPGQVFALPDDVSFEVGAALPLNYFTAEFVLARRAQLVAGETVLVHGAAGGVGTAALQVARALGARTIGVVSTAAKAEFARAAGADDVVLVDGFKDAVLERTDGRGVDVVVDVVGGDVFLDSLRALAPFGRLMVVGFAAGQGIPQVKVNRLLLANTDVRGAAWGGYSADHPDDVTAQWRRLTTWVAAGVVDPPIGTVRDLGEYPQLLTELAERRAMGKLLARVR